MVNLLIIVFQWIFPPHPLPNCCLPCSPRICEEIGIRRVLKCIFSTRLRSCTFVFLSYTRSHSGIVPKKLRKIKRCLHFPAGSDNSGFWAVSSCVFFFFLFISKVLGVTDGLYGLLLSKCKTHLLTSDSAENQKRQSFQGN